MPQCRPHSGRSANRGCAAVFLSQWSESETGLVLNERKVKTAMLNLARLYAHQVFYGVLEGEANGAWRDAADEKRFDLAMALTDDQNAVAVKEADYFASQGDWARAV